MSHASPHSTPSPRRERTVPPRGFELLQVVYVRRAHPDLGIQMGDSGTIVEIFDQPHRAYYVEFVNEDGTTRAEGAFTASELAVSPPEP